MTSPSRLSSTPPSVRPADTPHSRFVRLGSRAVARRCRDRLASTGTALLALLLAAGAAPGSAQAQEPDAGQSGEELGWSGTADFGLTVTSGNSETTSLSLGADATREFARQRLAFSANYLRTTEDGEEVANRGEARAGYRYFPGDRFFVTARTSASFNEPAGLDLRLSPGAGAGYVVVRGQGYQLSAEGGATWIRDAFVDGTTRSSFYYALAESFSLDLSETTRIEQELRYNPKADDLSDYLLHAEATLTTQITEAIGMRVTVIDDYDATPFQGGAGEPAAEKNDFTLITGVSVRW